MNFGPAVVGEVNLGMSYIYKWSLPCQHLYLYRSMYTTEMARKLFRLELFESEKRRTNNTQYNMAAAHLLANSNITSLKHNAVDLGAMHRKYTNLKVVAAVEVSKSGSEQNKKSLTEEVNQEYNFFSRKKEDQAVETTYAKMNKAIAGVPAVLKNHGQYAAKIYKMFESHDESTILSSKTQFASAGVKKIFAEGAARHNTNQACELSRGKPENSKYSGTEKVIPELSRDKQGTSRSRGAAHSISEDRDMRERSKKDESSTKLEGVSPTRNRLPNSPAKSRIAKRNDTAQSSEFHLLDSRGDATSSPTRSHLPQLQQSAQGGSKREVSNGARLRLENSVNGNRTASQETSKRTVELGSGQFTKHVNFAKAGSKTDVYSSKIKEVHLEEQKSKQSEDLMGSMAMQSLNTATITKSNLKETSLPRIKMSNSLDRSGSLLPKPG